MLDDRDLGELVGNEKQMRKNGSVLAVQPMKNFNRQFDFNPARHVKKCSGRNQRLVQRGELGRAKNSRLGHEMFSEKEIGRASCREREKIVVGSEDLIEKR